MAQDISPNTVAVLLIAVVVASAFATWEVLSAVDSVTPAFQSDGASAGDVSLRIQPPSEDGDSSPATAAVSIEIREAIS